MLLPTQPRVQPLHEIDRFFAAPRDRSRSPVDCQSRALERLVLGCERIRPHLASVEALESFIRMQTNPARVKRRISLAVAFETPEAELAYGVVGRQELETFRRVARRKLAAVVWVFS
jgi:hypothetical protein